MKSKSIRIDVDGLYGIRNGVPNMLEVLKEKRLKASFYLTIGRSSSIYDYLHLRGRTILPMILKKKKQTNKHIAVSNRYTLFQKLNMLIPRNLGIQNKKIINRIHEQGHEVSLHCYNHLSWSKNFDNLNLESEFERMIKLFKKITGRNPKGFVSPDFKYNKKVLKLLDKHGFTHSGDMKGKTPFKPIVNNKKFKHYQLPLSYPHSIEELYMKGFTEKKIINIYKKEIKKDYVNLYFHADWEGINGLETFEKILNLYKNSITHEGLIRKLKKQQNAVI